MHTLYVLYIVTQNTAITFLFFHYLKSNMYIGFINLYKQLFQFSDNTKRKSDTTWYKDNYIRQFILVLKSVIMSLIYYTRFVFLLI